MIVNCRNKAPQFLRSKFTILWLSEPLPDSDEEIDNDEEAQILIREAEKRQREVIFLLVL